MYVCVCTAVTERQIQDAVADGVQSMRALRETLGIVDTCGRCAQCALECLTEGLGRHRCAVECESACYDPATADNRLNA